MTETEQTKSTGRWLIKGTLTTSSPLHIGNGDTTTRPEILVSDKIDPATGKKKEIEINAVVTTGPDKRAYIPGSTIKGNLRAWLKQAGTTEAILEQIFGSVDSKKKDAVGGKAEFHDAFISNPISFSSDDIKRPPYWCGKRQTGVKVSVTIDRQTGTAREKRLFHEEYVPAGIKFGLVISGQDLIKDEVGWLIHALNDGCLGVMDMPSSIGSGTGDGNGRFDWQLEQVRELQNDGVKKWSEKCLEVGAGIIAKHGASYDFSEFSRPLFSKVKDLTIDIKLDFAGSFLVNDPSRVVKKITADSRPRLDHNGLPTLPGSAFRGALRSHAERIIRTVGGLACRVDDLENSCQAVSKAMDIEKRCLACRMFGAPGWKTLIEIAPFRLGTPEKLIFTQDFIAVDRFTGGVKEGAKFDADSLLKPQFEGKLTIDASRLEPWQMGLLALLLRDLEEGDITFGFGSTKGYGSCSATVSELDVARVRNREKFPAKVFVGKNDVEFINACIESFVNICAPPKSGKAEA